MSADINFGAITEVLNDKADRDLNNMTANIDYVVERYEDSEGNWYRVYKSGWLEQGGIILPPTTPETEVSLLKPFANVNYNLVLSAYNPSVVCTLHYREKTVTSFLNWAGTPSGGAASVTRVWRACGQGA